MAVVNGAGVSRQVSPTYYVFFFIIISVVGDWAIKDLLELSGVLGDIS